MPDDIVERLERHAEYTSCDPEIARAAADEITRLRAALSERAAVPHGWRLVPVEPTPEMVEAAFDALPLYPLEGKIRTHYRAMLAAAPSPPAGEAPTTTPEGQL